MLEDLQKYFAGKGPAISAKDMNTLGDAVRILRSITGENCFVDASGVYSRKAPNLLETITARLTGLTSGAYDWKEVAGKTDGTFVDVVGGRVSGDMGPAIDPTGSNSFGTGDSSDPVLLRRHTDPDSGDALWMIVASTSGGGAAHVVCKITATHTGGGKYKGFIVNGETSTATTSSNLSAADLGGVGTDEVMIQNMLEVGTSGHWIDTALPQVFFLCVPTGAFTMSGTNSVQIVNAMALQTPACA